MARKKLLTEGEIRQFMKLANLHPISNGRLSEYGMGVPGARDEEEMESELGATEGELGAEDAMADEEGDELALDDAEMDMGAEEGGGDMVSMEDFMTALEQAIEEVTGEEADVSEEPGEEEGEEEVGMEMDMEMGPEGGEEMEMGEEEIVAEILRRLREDKPFTAKKEKPGADIRKGAKKRGAEGTKKKTSGKGHGEEEGEDAYVNELESPSAARARSGGRRYTPRGTRRGDEEGEFGAIGPVLSGEEDEKLSPTEYDPEEEEELSRYGGRGSFKGRRPPTGVGIPGITSEQLVNTIAKRVATRLKAESRKAQMVDTLAERIMHRLTK
jgi:hypothetical protein